MASIPSGDKVLGLGVMADDGGCRLLGVELEPLADFNADLVGGQQLDHLGVVLEIRAGRVAPGVAPAAVLLTEQSGQGRPRLVGFCS